MRKAVIRHVSYHLPSTVVGNDDLDREFPDWEAVKLGERTGIQERRIVGEDQFSSDLANAAAQQLFDETGIAKDSIDGLILCTQTPDYLLPTTACIVQSKLGLPTRTAAFDINLGCSGYIYGLGVASALISSGQMSRVVLITADTFSKYLNARDRSVRTVFGDGASATLVEISDAPADAPGTIGPIVYGTDGRGASRLIVPRSGMHAYVPGAPTEYTDASGNTRSDANLYMNGVEVFVFTLRAVPECVRQLLTRAELEIDDVDVWILHQANAFVLENLRKKLGIASDKFVISMGDCGNTVSSTIPIALRRSLDSKRIGEHSVVAMIGFGVGYSWAGAIARW